MFVLLDELTMDCCWVKVSVVYVCSVGRNYGLFVLQFVVGLLIMFCYLDVGIPLIASFGDVIPDRSCYYKYYYSCLIQNARDYNMI